MPLINLSFSSKIEQNWQPQGFLLQAHEIIASTANTDLNNCKSTISCQQAYVIGDNDPQHAFVILTVELLAGRPDDIKQTLSEQLLTALKSHLAPVKPSFNVQLSCHIKDLNSKHYYKDRLVLSIS